MLYQFRCGRVECLVFGRLMNPFVIVMFSLEVVLHPNVNNGFFHNSLIFKSCVIGALCLPKVSYFIQSFQGLSQLRHLLLAQVLRLIVLDLPDDLLDTVLGD